MKLFLIIFAGLTTLAQAGVYLHIKLEIPASPVIEPHVVEPKIPPSAPRKIPKGYMTIGRIIPNIAIEPSPDGLVELYGGSENFGIAVVPEQIELWRLSRTNTDRNRIGDYTEVSRVDMPSVDAFLLGKYLTADSSINWEDDYDCAPDYGFRVKFIADGKTVNVDLCFACRQLRVFRDGKQSGEKNFEYVYQNIFDLVDRLCPGVLDKED